MLEKLKKIHLKKRKSYVSNSSVLCDGRMPLVSFAFWLTELQYYLHPVSSFSGLTRIAGGQQVF